MALTAEQKQEILDAIGYAKGYGIPLAPSDFRIIDGDPCIDGMDPTEWVDHMSGKATGDLDTIAYNDTEAQYRATANAIAQQAEALALGKIPDKQRYAQVRRILDNVNTLMAWTPNPE